MGRVGTQPMVGAGWGKGFQAILKSWQVYPAAVSESP